MDTSRFPMPIESLLASTAAMLKEEGAAREVSVLVDANPTIVLDDYDNWNGGTYDWCIELHLHHRHFGVFATDERTHIVESLARCASPFLPENHRVGFRLFPSAVDSEHWRDEARQWLAGAGTNNQGRVRTDNVASRQHDGLLFRSTQEILLYKAFKGLGVTFAPLPVFIRGGETYARLEPDFVLLKDGRVMAVEVDGDTYHRETPAEAHRRLLPLDHEGAKIERVAASEVDTEDKARGKARALLDVLAKLSKR